MRAVALALTLSLVTTQTACFPDNPKARTISKITEGALLAGGVIMEALTNASSDCMVSMPGEPDSGCKNSANLYSSIGVVLILAGLGGFLATISTTPDEPNKPRNEIKAAPTPVPVVAPPVATPVVTVPPPAPVAPAPAATP